MNPHLYTLWLYGSVARGDHDPWSDLDLLAVGPVPDEDIAVVGAALNRVPSVSTYSWDEIEMMASYGSLFLHHLRLEGRCLCNPDGAGATLTARLASLGPYLYIHRDLRSFRMVVADVRMALSQGGGPRV